MTSQSNSSHYFSCLGIFKLKKTLIVMIYFSLSGGIDQQISVFSFTFSLPWLLKQNSFFRNQFSSRFSVLYFLFSLRSHHQPRAWSLIVHVRYTSLRGFTDKIAKFWRFHCLVIARRDWQTKKTKSNQERIQKFRKGWPGHLPAIWILFILLRILVGVRGPCSRPQPLIRQCKEI